MLTSALQLTHNTAPSSPSSTAGTADQLVQVWFGAHIVCAYRADPEAAERYATAMSRRFAGLKVTITPPAAHSPGARMPLPSLPRERMWELTP